MLEQGTYDAVPSDWGYTKVGEKQTPAVYVEFQAATGNIRWTGYLTERAKERTLSTLIDLGFRDSSFARFVKGARGEAISTNSVQIVVENETHNGKEFPRVKWINVRKPAMAIPAAKAAQELDGLRADTAKIMAARGITPDANLELDLIN